MCPSTDRSMFSLQFSISFAVARFCWESLWNASVNAMEVHCVMIRVIGLSFSLINCSMRWVYVECSLLSSSVFWNWSAKLAMSWLVRKIFSYKSCLPCLGLNGQLEAALRCLCFLHVAQYILFCGTEHLKLRWLSAHLKQWGSFVHFTVSWYRKQVRQGIGLYVIG